MKFSKWINKNTKRLNENKKRSLEQKKNFINSVWQKYAPTVPGIDRERYNDLKGLEGPFRLRSGKVVYYDPKEGKYYDRDSDMYMSHDEYDAHANPRNESISVNQQIDQVKQNRKNLGAIASTELTNIMNALQLIAKENPTKFRLIVSMIQKEIRSTDKSLSQEIGSKVRMLINKTSNV